MSTTAADALLELPPFAAAGPGADFLRAAVDCLSLLVERFPRYRAFLQRHDVPALALSTLAELDALPPLFLPVLKSRQFPLPPDLPITVELTSSGTTGQPSRTPQDEPSWQRRVRAMLTSYQALDLFDRDVQALAFLLDPATTKMAGSLVIDAVLRQAPQVKSITYLARMGPTGPTFDHNAALQQLQQAVAVGPVLLVGYPALMSAALQALARAGVARFLLPSGSRILTGGGWKSFLPGVVLDQEQFRSAAGDFFDIPPAGIRDMYGLSECPAVFVQCEHGHYHIPAWAWAQAIDPETRRAVSEGEVGLLQLTVPLTTSYPLLKILTTDKATMHSGCPCGRAAPHLKPRGRVTAARFETCAMKIGRAAG